MFPHKKNVLFAVSVEQPVGFVLEILVDDGRKTRAMAPDADFGGDGFLFGCAVFLEVEGGKIRIRHGIARPHGFLGEVDITTILENLDVGEIAVVGGIDDAEGIGIAARFAFENGESFVFLRKDKVVDKIAGGGTAEFAGSRFFGIVLVRHVRIARIRLVAAVYR